MKKFIFSLVLLMIGSTTICVWEDTVVIRNPNNFAPDTEYVSGINLPWLVDYNYEWGNELLIIAKNIFNRALEYLPMLILILLLLACLKMIFEWDGKAWFKRIKYILIWVAIMILSIYIMNVVSTILSWYPLINIHFNKLY